MLFSYKPKVLVKVNSSSAGEKKPPTPVKQLFKQALLNDILTTGFGNPDKWFEYYECSGLTADDAIQAAYELRTEHGYNIEGEPPLPNTPPELIEPIKQAVLMPQDYITINRPYFLENMLLNITNGYSNTMLKNKDLPATKEKYLQCYWDDTKHLAKEYNITIEDLQPFFTVKNISTRV